MNMARIHVKTVTVFDTVLQLLRSNGHFLRGSPLELSGNPAARLLGVPPRKLLSDVTDFVSPGHV